MAVFSIVAFENEVALGDAIAGHYGASTFQFSSSMWLVADVGTTKDVADRIGLTDGRNGAQGVVLKFSGYSGYAPVAAWQWLARFSDLAANG